MISVLQLGQLDYCDGLLLQQKLVDLRKAEKIGDALLLLEHSPVITLGRNAESANVLASVEALAARGVELFECDRGGDVTFHGPGQLVGYPVLDLRSHELLPLDGDIRDCVERAASPAKARDRARKTLGAVDYVRRLEEVLIRSCADFGIATHRVSGLTGVWTEASRVMTDRDYVAEPDQDCANAKIAAIGVHISRSVTSHGFALNVNTDLSYFDLIVPCGIANKPVTSMQKEAGRHFDLETVAQSISRNFGIVFGQQMLWVENLDSLLGQTVGVPMKIPDELRHIRGEEDSFLA